MKFGFLLLLLWGAGLATAAEPAKTKARPVRAGACLVAEFKTLTLGIDEAPVRAREARAWLLRNVGQCKPEQLSAIKNNSPAWLGTALTPELYGLIEGAIEAKVAGDPTLMGQLYESLGKEGSASELVYKNPTPRAPVVQVQPILGGVGGAVNYGNIAGPATANLNQTGNFNSGQIQQPSQTIITAPPLLPVDPQR
jgi:hypothetical protein